MAQVFDGDGHVFEDSEAIGRRMPDLFRRWKYAHGIFAKSSWFPALGHLHTPTGTNPPGAFGGGSFVGMPEWLRFLDATGIEAAALYPTDALTIGSIQNADYQISVTRAYNDWLCETYTQKDKRFLGMALLPLQEPQAAVEELRRAVQVLGFPGAMLPTTGFKGHLGAKEYWPIYAEAERLGCALGIHGGNHIGFGMDSMNVFAPAHAIGHALGMMIALGGLVFNGVFDRYPGLRIAFLESGVSWLLFCIERFDSSHRGFTPLDLRGELLQLRNGESVRDYIVRLAREDRIYVGCEGDELMLAEAIKVVGIRPFFFSSDFPHEVNAGICRHHIEEVEENTALDAAARAAILRENAARFYRQARA